jgi:hypothetical protein
VRLHRRPHLRDVCQPQKRSNPGTRPPSRCRKLRSQGTSPRDPPAGGSRCPCAGAQRSLRRGRSPAQGAPTTEICPCPPPSSRCRFASSRMAS